MSGCASAGVIELRLKEPDAYLDYSENVQKVITDPDTGEVDPLASLTLTSKPSGAGELVLSRLTVDTTGFLVTWWAAGGVPGRWYDINLEGVTAAGRQYQWAFIQHIDPWLMTTWPPPSPPSLDVGPATTWNA